MIQKRSDEETTGTAVSAVVLYVVFVIRLWRFYIVVNDIILT